MPSSTRYTVHLPPPLDARVQERIRTSGTPFAVLMREALSAYLADTAPTGTRADSAATLGQLQAQLAALTTRVEVLEQRQSKLPTAPTPADSADSAPTRARADTPQVRPPGGQYKLTPRQVRTLRARRQRGVPIQTLMQEYGVSRATLFRYLA